MAVRTFTRRGLALSLCVAATLMPVLAHARSSDHARSAVLVSIHMNSATAGWAIDRSAIVRTTNRGVAWQDVTPRGVSLAKKTVTATYFPSTQTAWIALMDRGVLNPTAATIVHTGDGGRTWHRGGVGLAGPGRVAQILFLAGGRIGWLFADLGAGMGSEGVQIFRSIDAGAHWVSVAVTAPPHSSPGSLPLGGIKSGLGFRDPLVGFATGVIYGPPGFAYLYATADGGHTWRHQALLLPRAYQGDNPDLAPPIFFTARDGVLPATLAKAGLAQVLYVTHNGGVTWRATTPVPHTRNLDVVTPRDAWAVASPGAASGSATRPLRLYVTHDGGLHWAASGPNAAIRDGALLDFIDNRTGFTLYSALGGGTSTLLKTTDGGHTWSALHPYVTPDGQGTGVHPDGQGTGVQAATVVSAGTVGAAGTAVVDGTPSPTPTAGPSATAVPAGGTVVLGFPPVGTPVRVRVGATILIAAGPLYTVSDVRYDPAILAPGGPTGDGSAILRAVAPGTTRVTGTASPRCLQAHPACGLPSALLAYTIEVVAP